MRGQWIRLWVAFLVGLGLGVGAEASSREQILGQVRLSGGLPVAGAQVMLFDLADLRRGVVAQTTTDALGSFALPLGRRPNGVVLGQNYPNPFNPSTMIPYELSSSSWVRLEVFNLLGQRLALLVDGEQEAGAHRARWDGTDGSGRAAAAGVYLYRLTVGESSQTGRMVLVDGQAGVPLGGSGVEVVPSLGSDGSSGLVVLGDGIVAYVDASFEMASGPVAIEVASARGARGKAAQEGILGDVNNNGRVDADDALLVMAYSLKGSVSLPDGGDISLGDVDRDGRITVTDAWLIATYVIDPADPVLPLGIGTPISLEVDSLEVDSLEADTFDQVVAQIQTLEAELEQIDLEITEYRENHLLNAPQDQFETDAEYASRISRLDSIVAQSRQGLRESYRFKDKQTQISQLYRSIFPTDVTMTLGTYDANEEYFPVTLEVTLNGESQSYNRNLMINRDDARSLYNNWERVIKTGYLSIDPGYRQALAMVKLNNPIRQQEFTIEFVDEIHHLTDDHNAVAFSPDGRYLATGFYGVITSFWRMSDGQRIWHVSPWGVFGYYGYRYGVAFSPDGRYLATGDDDGRVALRAADDGTLIRQMETEESHVRAIAFSPDGQYLAADGVGADRKTNVTIWRVTIGQKVQQIDAGNIYDLAFSPDGKYFAAGDDEGNVILWEVSSWSTSDVNSQYMAREPDSQVKAIAFSPDGQYLAADGYDRGNDNTYITIWEVISGRKVHQIDAGNVYALAFSPDGKYLAAGDDEGIITFYQIPINITLTTRVTKERTIQAIRAVEDLAWSPYGRFISDGKKVYRVLLDLSSRD